MRTRSNALMGLLLLGGFGLCHGETPPLPADDPRMISMQARRFITDGYRQAALTVLLEAVNSMAKQMGLPENLPITRSNLVEAYIQPPAWSEGEGGFGTISTADYSYTASTGNKLSQVQWKGCSVPGYLEMLKRKYAKHKDEVDTGRAHSLATNWLAAAGADVAALDRDCEVFFHTQSLGDKFVPAYWVTWRKPAASIQPISPQLSLHPESQSIAGVWLLEPENRLFQLSVSDPKYLLGPELRVPDRTRLMQQTEDARMRRYWYTTERYETAALELALKEANWACERLQLPERLPLVSSNLTKVTIATPFVTDNLGHFGTIRTKHYTYSVTFGNKLSWIEQNLSAADDKVFLAALKSKYLTASNRIDTAAAYSLATNCLSAVKVDIPALERDYKPVIRPWVIGNQFVPLYEISWESRSDSRSPLAACVEVLTPERRLKSLVVQKSQYIRRTPLVVTNRDQLLQAELPK